MTDAGDLRTAEREAVSLRQRWNRLLVLARRRHVGLVVLVAVITTAVVLPIGRATAPRPNADASRAVQIAVLPLALDADGIWTSGSVDRPPVSEAFVSLRREGDPEPILENADHWLMAYDAALLRLAGLDLPPTARPVQRHFIAAITLSRDAVEVLRHAAGQENPRLRLALTTEAGRLRQRSEQLTQSARAAADDLQSGSADVAPFPEITQFAAARPAGATVPEPPPYDLSHA